MCVFVVIIGTLGIGVIGLNIIPISTDYKKEYQDCEEWLELVRITGNDYDYILMDALEIAENKCDFDVIEFLTR